MDVMDPSWRMPGNAAFNGALDEVVAALEASGYVAEGPGVTAPLTYRMERRELSRPTWDPIQASLRIVGQDEPLMTLASNINLMGANSFSTPAGGIEAELVDVGGGSAADFEGKDVGGRSSLATGVSEACSGEPSRNMEPWVCWRIAFPPTTAPK